MNLIKKISQCPKLYGITPKNKTEIQTDVYFNLNMYLIFACGHVVFFCFFQIRISHHLGHF